MGLNISNEKNGLYIEMQVGNVGQLQPKCMPALR